MSCRVHRVPGVKDTSWPRPSSCQPASDQSVSDQTWCGRAWLLAALDPQVGLHPFLILLNDAVILAQWMSFPTLGQQDALQVGMPIEANPKHVEDFTFQPVRGRPYRDCARDAFAVRDQDFHANAFVPWKRIENPEDIKLFFPLGIVHGGNVHAVIKLLSVAKDLQHLGNNRRFHHHIVLAEVGICFANARAVLALERGDHRGFPWNWGRTGRVCRRTAGAPGACAAGFFSPLGGGVGDLVSSGMTTKAQTSGAGTALENVNF